MEGRKKEEKEKMKFRPTPLRKTMLHSSSSSFPSFLAITDVAEEWRSSRKGEIQSYLGRRFFYSKKNVKKKHFCFLCVGIRIEKLRVDFIEIKGFGVSPLLLEHSSTSRAPIQYCSSKVTSQRLKVYCYTAVFFTIARLGRF